MADSLTSQHSLMRIARQWNKLGIIGKYTFLIYFLVIVDKRVRAGLIVTGLSLIALAVALAGQAWEWGFVIGILIGLIAGIALMIYPRR